MATETLTTARLRGLQHEDGEIIDAKSAASARADRNGVVSFSTRYRFGKKRPRIFLGTFPLMSLADARIASNRVHEQVRSGIDPQAERQAKSEAQALLLSFDQLSDLYITRYAMRSKSSWKLDQRHLRVDVSPHWGKRAASSITRQDAVKLLFGIAERAPVGANRVKAILSKLFSWSVDSGLLDKNPMWGVKSPTREGRGKTRALNDQEIYLLWRALETAEAGPGIVAALKLLLVVGSRPGEVMGMVSGELHQLDNVDGAYWEIPAHRMKARKAHIVPLPPLARDIVLAELDRPRRSDLVFGGRFAARRIAHNSLAQALRRVIDGIGEEGASIRNDPVTPHDLRRSAISGMSRIGVSRDDRMAIAAHSYGDAHSVYDRYDRLHEKRAALARWENHLRRVIAGEPGGGAEIIPLRSA